jgi:hypothetical protein
LISAFIVLVTLSFLYFEMSAISLHPDTTRFSFLGQWLGGRFMGSLDAATTPPGGSGTNISSKPSPKRTWSFSDVAAFARSSRSARTASTPSRTNTRSVERGKSRLEEIRVVSHPELLHGLLQDGLKDKQREDIQVKDIAQIVAETML